MKVVETPKTSMGRGLSSCKMPRLKVASLRLTFSPLLIEGDVLLNACRCQIVSVGKERPVLQMKDPPEGVPAPV
jgi:hypothetical protein